MDSIVWSSYIGSASNDAAMSLKLNSKNELLVTGVCGANTFDFKPSGIHSSFLGVLDGFVAKISNDGDSILAYTYIGTSRKDISYFVELDANDDVYLLGQTYGNYGFDPKDVYKVENEGVFVHKLGKDLDTSYFYTTIGDTLNNVVMPDFSPTAFLVNECGNIFVAGWGGETNYNQTGYTYHLPITNNAYQKTSDGSDFYMAVFEKEMKSLLYATYFGVDGVAEHVDGGTSRFSNSGIVYQSVCAGCGGKQFITYPSKSEGQYPKQNASANCNNGVFKYDLSSLSARIAADDGCGPLTQYFTNHTVGGVDYYWNFGDGTDTLLFTKETVAHTYKNAGSYRVTMICTDLTTCKGKDTTSTLIYVSDRLKHQNFGDTLCKGETKLWDKYTDTGFKYEWSPATGLSEINIKNPMITADSTIQYIVTMTDTLGCIRKDTVDIFVPFFIPNLSVGALAACQHLSIPKIEMLANYRSNFVPDSLTWKIDDFTIIAIGDKFIFTPQNFGVHKVVVTAKNDICSFSETSSINLPQIKIPNVITPNHDGKNDAFVIEGLEYGGTWSLLVVNRWGKEIFKADDYRNNWDAPIEAPGTYFYEIEAPDGTKCKGWLQVVK
jgi:gliding motility-associated-like protein